MSSRRASASARRTPQPKTTRDMKSLFRNPFRHPIRPRPRLIPAAALVWLVVAATVRPAAAHPMGNFSITHYAPLQVEADEVRVRYRLDLAEISAAQEMSAIDTDGDRQVSEAERAAYM